MCGIVGQIAHQASAGGERENISPALIAMMARRGPDDEGLWSDGQGVMLGFRRLAILDPSPAGHQPMVTQNGRYVIVYNGEVYNFRELRHELEQYGRRFRSTGDTEVVLNALAHWGTEALSRFNGMFALAFYDTVERRLLLARDHAGIKPLYYMLTQRGLVFASQYDQILAHPWSQNLAIATDALGLYLRIGYIPAPYAMFQKTHMLEPGTWLETTRDERVRKGRFFEFPVFREPNLYGQEACEAVDAAVTAAVRRQLVSDVPVGTFLSGGIDSPLVTAKMRAVYDGQVRAFTIGTNGDHLDESSDAMAYARELGVEHFIDHITLDRALGMLDDVMDACGEPFADYSIFPTILLSRMARQHVKVLLSGDGADELFWGYERFASLIKRAAELTGSSDARKSALNGKNFAPVGNDRQPVTSTTSLGMLHRRNHTRLPEAFLRRVFPDLPEWPTELSLFGQVESEADRVAQCVRWNEFTGYLPMILLKIDRGSMYNSLEVRVPFLDREVIEVATRVDWRSCMDVERRIGKLPLRYSLGRHVQHQTWDKRGFTFSMGTWLKNSLRPVFEDVLLDRQEILGLPMDTTAAREIFDNHLSGKAEYGYGLWVLLSLGIWEKRHRNRWNRAATA